MNRSGTLVPMRVAILLLVVGVLHDADAAAAGELRCAGILANSGEAGETLVRFGTREARGLGVVVDKYGMLWDRAGAGLLNRYTPDGRLVSQFEIRTSTGRYDAIAIAGDTILLMIRDVLYALDVDAPTGSTPRKIDVSAEQMSLNSYDGRIALAKKTTVFLYDVAEGKRIDASYVSLPRVDGLAFGPDGALYVAEGGRLHKYVDGAEVAGFRKKKPGDRMQFVNGAWYGHAWHGTIFRYSESFAAAPGVVQGGASGSFIGHLPQNSELENGRGMAHLRDGLYAVSGMGCVMHLLEWNTSTKTMDIVRRIGAMPHVPGIGLDDDGRIYLIDGIYRWSDGPDAPQRFGGTGAVIGQVAMLGNGSMVAPGVQYGNRPRVIYGTFDKEVDQSGHDKLKFDKDMMKHGCGTVVFRIGGRLSAMIVSPSGKTQAFEIDGQGKYRKKIGEVRLSTSTDVKHWTSLAMKDADTLLAGADGAVIEFARDGSGWKETRRHRKIGGLADGRLGDAVHIVTHDDRLWISDTSRHRVICANVQTMSAVATFGIVDSATTALDGLSSPKAIAAWGTRAVVFDSANQRVMKLELIQEETP